jgi:hypothetical protein
LYYLLTPIAQVHRQLVQELVQLVQEQFEQVEEPLALLAQFVLQ